MLFGLLVCMGCGAVYAIVPFINKDAVGSVSGIVGAGGNVGAVLSSFLFGASDWHHSLLILGCVVAGCSLLAFGVRFTPVQEREDEVLQPPPAGAVELA